MGTDSIILYLFLKCRLDTSIQYTFFVLSCISTSTSIFLLVLILTIIVTNTCE
ncbi:uncharacterized protein BO88DRAFT_174031 [Aspergillus vadensis CBS 113365]|uniref:Uncharacterized protein n=1 Tax=Aspergillus vadensis (strain CBS 113365 / IMI 142717 / IBT 24658) TaxID=1448311 RepID=A0A319C3Y1_ASPVC|nr:hypothetical protein BO88DRAFT_174031 [Aspergillus vadensis CBS 113365]PYH72963.1 hypothetical protein BO88DRAFT_174031 [Aspergillus vadensis CBS 113365]